jgi:DNA-binding transcriptional regulator YhcF (GntR family)
VIVSLDLTLATPPYEQIRSAIAGAISQGQLAAAARLPTVRQLARDLRVAPATVAHAYRELERDGLVYSAGRKGTFVAASHGEVRRSLESLAQDYVEHARRIGADRAAIMHAVIDALPGEH